MATASTPDRASAEIEHGRTLSLGDPEATWGWGTPAGRLRAERRATFVREGAALAPGKRVLEVGCGTGLFTEMFATSGADIIAVDISEDLLIRARARGIPNAVFVSRRFEDCKLDGPFDAVIGSSVLHHLELPHAIEQMFDLLKPGGQFSFAEPNYMNPQVFLERRLRFIKPLFWHVSPDETAFVRWPLRRELERIGFTNVAITPFDWLHPATPPGMIPLVRAVGRQFERTPGVREFSGSLHIRAQRPR